MDKSQREAEFKREFDKLLKSYGAEVELVDIGEVCDGWHCQQAVRVSFGVNPVDPKLFHEFHLAL